MIPNILFKVISNDPINKSIVVKFCRENAQKSIDEYRSYNISYRNIDFSSPKAFEDSMRSRGNPIIMKQLLNEPPLEVNKGVPEILSTDINDYVGKIVCTTSETSGSLNRIALWLMMVTKGFIVDVMNLRYVLILVRKDT